MNTTVEIRQGLFEEDINKYHGTKAISSSLFRTFLKSRKRFKYEWDNWDNKEFKKSETFKIGSAFHTLLLEPHKYNERYIVAENVNRRSKEGKLYIEEINKLGKDVLSIEDEEMLRGMEASVKNSELAMKYMEQTQSELSARRKLSNGLIVQCRPDAVKKECIIDLKSCADITKFNYEIYSYGYYIQAAYYWWLLSNIDPEKFSESNFYFIAVEKNSPYELGIYGIENVTLSRIVEETIKPGLIDLGKFINEEVHEELINWFELK